MDKDIETLGSMGLVDEPAPETINEEPADEPGNQPPVTNEPIDEEPAPTETPEDNDPEPAPEDDPNEGNDIKKRLDDAFSSITEGVQKHDDKKDEKANPPSEETPSDDGKKKPADEKPKSEAEEEAEMLASTNNERTRQRFQKIIGERNEFREIAQSFSNEIQRAGYDQNTFAQVLEFGRLISSNDANQKRAALEMLDGVRKNLAADLGEEVPGVDLLSDFPDLQQSVQDMNLDRKQALELAAARRQQEAMRLQQADAQRNVQIRQSMQNAQYQINQTLMQKQSDPNFVQKVNAIHKWLMLGDNMANFVQSVPPEQWSTKIEQLYNSVPQEFYTPQAPQTAQAKRRPNTTQPLRSRPMNIGPKDDSKLSVSEYSLGLMKDM